MDRIQLSQSVPSITILADKANQGAKLKVIGVGGCGGNAVNTLITKGLRNVEFLAANTDIQALNSSKAEVKLQIGGNLTRGLGAGAVAEVGKKAAEENSEEIRKAIAGADMLFVTAGMGGGTGTGAAPYIAKMGRELGSLVVGIVTKPFNWEGIPRRRVADNGIEELRQNVDALLVVPNQKILSIIDKNTSVEDAFQKADDVLVSATRGISEIISESGLINVDFADVRSVMKDMGDALMGIGVGKGEHRAIEAAQNALNSPLLDGVTIQGAQGALVNIRAGKDFGMLEADAAMQEIQNSAGDDANLIFGLVVDNTIDTDEVTITIVATGFAKKEAKRDGTETAQEPKTLFPQEKGQFERPSARKQATPMNINSPSRSFINSFAKENKNLEEPAYLRNQGSIRIDRTANYDSPTFETVQANEQQEAAPKFAVGGSSRPAFLRKIMD